MKTNFKSFLLLCLFFASINYAQTKIIVKGNVVESSGIPLPYVNVYVENTLDGAMSDEDGSFTFSTDSDTTITIIASMVGYKSEKKVFEVKPGNKEINVEFGLAPDTIELEEAVVMGSSFSSEKEKGIIISSMEVMMTPGGAADIYQSLKTMPGLTNVSESAELYVRGGDPIETVTIIDQASIYHPYTYESSYGGLFSNLNTAAVDAMYFSSGGFSTKYGNVLSGVLDISTKNEPINQRFDLGISMAALQLNAEIPIVDNKFGMRIFGMQSFTKPIMWLNGELDEFTTTPSSNNITALISYKYSETGRMKFTGIFAADAQGVKIRRAEYSGAFNGNSNTNFYNFQLNDVLFENTFIKSSVSFSQFENLWRLGVLDLDQTDGTYKLRMDLETTFSKQLKMDYGIEGEMRNQHYVGAIPESEFDIRPDAEKVVLDAEIIGQRIGVYGELTFNNIVGIKKLHAIAGVRSDHFSQLNLTSFDPRFGLVYKLSAKSNFRFAWGIFHQLPDTRLFVSTDGNPDLKSMKAEHFVFSYEYRGDKNNSIRLELFQKDYTDLPLEDENINYNNDGFGYARGLDFVLKGDLPFNLDGWLSYGYINTKRKWMDFDKLTSSGFDITHNLSMILKYNINAMWQIGLNVKYSSGRPFTPIESSEYLADRKIYEPLYGANNSERYPDYKRVDLRVTHLNQLFGKYFAVFYLEGLNILNINNLFGYTYSTDYKQKEKVLSYFGRRTIVIGTSISI